MHPLHEYVAAQLSERLRDRQVVVWYDPRREFAAFVAELREGATAPGPVATVILASASTRMTEYRGSFFEVRALIEPFVDSDQPEPMLVYVAGVDRDSRASVLMEVEKAGEVYERQLKRLARQVLRRRYTDGVIDEMLASERVTYDDLVSAMSDSTPHPPSLLKAIYRDAPGGDAILAAWLVKDGHDSEVEEKGAVRELVQLVRSRLGLQLPGDTAVAKLRSVTLRYVLAGEFRADLKGAAPANLDGVPAPETKEEEAAVRGLAARLRTSFASDYAALADRVEAELGLREAPLAAESLGSVDTFRFEERSLLGYCGTLIAAKRFDEALAVVGERETSFWLDRDLARKAQWEACRRMAELGAASLGVGAAVRKAGGDAETWVEAYATKDGWHCVDRAQRRLEAWVANLDDSPDEVPLGVVRRLYEDVCHTMAEGFTRALAKAHWAVPGTLHQTKIFSEVVTNRPRPVAYFFVDAMRFEMGLDLIDRLPKSAEISARPAVSVLPSITPLGMAALLPGAAGSFSVIEENGKLGARIEEAFLPDLPARKKLTAARVPGLLDLTLDELLSLPPTKLAKRVEGAQVVVVRSQEIDHAGEGRFTFQARQVMDTVIDNLSRAIRKLATAGVEQAVVTADHGHLFFPVDRDESMRTDSPGGATVELHRRCWIGRGGSTPTGCIRVAASELGYASDLEFVFPTGCGVFKGGGGLAFHHGGPSLQEMILPVLSVRLKVRDSVRPGASAVTVTDVPKAVTNRIFSVSLLFKEQIELGKTTVGTLLVRPLLMAGGRQVGKVGMAVDAELDRKTECVKLHPGKPVTVAFQLTDETAASFRIVIQDPASDADLYRSPTDIPVRLGV